MNIMVSEMMEKVKNNQPLDEKELKVFETMMYFAQKLLYEHIADTPFICGQSGEVREGDKMPEYFFICPSYGCDFSVLFKRDD